MTAACPFCARVTPLTGNAFVFMDEYPVTRGHALVVPRRHVEHYFDCTDDEKSAIWACVDALHAQLKTLYAPDGFNVGFNAGAAAGQTVPHVHVHVIPRYVGDVEDPRGGVRGVIPARRHYSVGGSL